MNCVRSKVVIERVDELVDVVAADALWVETVAFSSSVENVGGPGRVSFSGLLTIQVGDPDLSCGQVSILT